MLETLISSKTRLRLLVKFFVNAANSAHMRGLAQEFNESTNSIRKELNNLSEAGYLNKAEDGRKIAYQANVQHPLYHALQDIVRKYLGLDTIVEKVLERMGAVAQVWLVGDYAIGRDTGVIEVVIVGKDLNKDYLENLSQKIEKLINRKVIFELSDEPQAGGLLLYG